MTQAIDHLALLPTYLAAGTAVLALLADLIIARRAPTLAVTATGFLATAIAALLVPAGRETFCTPHGCSYVTSNPGALVTVVLCALSLGVLALSVPALRRAEAPAGEYAFLLACSLTGGVALAYARDLITIVVALETLTLPLYVLVAFRGQQRSSADAAVNFLLVSVSASAVTLFGAALLFAVTGQVQLSGLAERLEAGVTPLAAVAMTLVVVGLSFKVAAVPLHGWAPGTYDGAPLPIAAYLSTASKLGGTVALVWVVAEGFASTAMVAGVALAMLAVASMTTGNLIALRQSRAVRLLAWSSIAQAGYLLAPLGALAALGGASDVRRAAGAVLGFAVLYVIVELTAFAGVIALRGAHSDGGSLRDYVGLARRRPLAAGALLLGLLSLAGLPPGLAGLFAKITVVSAVAELAPWLAVVIAGNAVIGLVYYLRFCTLVLYGRAARGPAVAPWPVVMAVTAVAAVAVVTGLAPQVVLDFATLPQ